MKLLEALRGQNTGRPPVWFMRQAGRYLPEYRSLRQRYSLFDLFLTPELAVEVALQPLRRFPLDAAILFSDITVVALALGLDLTFMEGPVVSPQVTPENVEGLPLLPEALQSIYETCRLLKQQLHVPLLGFSGAPFTVASYLIGTVEKTLEWMRRAPQSFGVLMQKIETITLIYLKNQVRFGADAVQLFDSWANVLSADEFQVWTIPFLKRACQELSVPVVFFMRKISERLDSLRKLPLALSLDEEIEMGEARKKTKQVLQGNLAPNLLFRPIDEVSHSTKKLLETMKDDGAFILNLGHGIKPGTPIEAIEEILKVCKTFA